MPSRKPRQSPGFILGPADEPLLEALNAFDCVSAEQLRRFFERGSLPYMRKRLQVLSENGYVLRVFLPRPTRIGGSEPYLYTLDMKGRKYLRDRPGIEVRHRFRPSETQKGYDHFAHLLAINDVIIAAKLLCRDNPTLKLAEVIHERDMPSRVGGAVAFQVTNRATGSQQTEREKVIPDGYLLFHVLYPDGWYQEPYALEVDRGTTEVTRFKKRVLARLAWTKGPYRELFNIGALTFMYFAVGRISPYGDSRKLTPQELEARVQLSADRRRDEMKHWVEEVLSEYGAKQDARLFRFTSAPTDTTTPATLFHSRCWYQPYEAEPTPLIEPHAQPVYLNSP